MSDGSLINEIKEKMAFLSTSDAMNKLSLEQLNTLKDRLDRVAEFPHQGLNEDDASEKDSQQVSPKTKQLNIPFCMGRGRANCRPSVSLPSSTPAVVGNEFNNDLDITDFLYGMGRGLGVLKAERFLNCDTSHQLKETFGMEQAGFKREPVLKGEPLVFGSNREPFFINDSVLKSEQQDVGSKPAFKTEPFCLNDPVLVNQQAFGDKPLFGRSEPVLQSEPLAWSSAELNALVRELNALGPHPWKVRPEPMWATMTCNRDPCEFYVVLKQNESLLSRMNEPLQALLRLLTELGMTAGKLRPGDYSLATVGGFARRARVLSSGGGDDAFVRLVDSGRTAFVHSACLGPWPPALRSIDAFALRCASVDHVEAAKARDFSQALIDRFQKKYPVGAPILLVPLERADQDGSYRVRILKEKTSHVPPSKGLGVGKKAWPDTCPKKKT